MMFALSILICVLIRIDDSACNPIPFEMVDLTYVFDNTTLYWPEQKKFELKVILNGTMSDGYWFQIEEYFSGIHVGTHMDAPCHFAKGRWCVDEIPLERLVVPAAVIDITEKAEKDRDALVEVEDLLKWEFHTGHTLDGATIMVRSGWSKRWPDREAYTGTADYDPKKLHFPGVSKDAAQWLVDNRNIYGLGIDTLSVDNGISKDFMTHRILYDKNIYGLENVANLDKIPLYGATIIAMPMKVGKGSGAPVRLVATFPRHLVYFGKK
ncbi:isatin hydrolase-like [Argiope bruennichi]|uniref:isatin hydrolase-like n=1 Tax=Argiope bruennichi TaxID=94029 RepID=UPI0024957FA0|nr:isatin hydrolase-like [Argiope bruennichi]